MSALSQHRIPGWTRSKRSGVSTNCSITIYAGGLYRIATYSFANETRRILCRI